MTGAPPKPSDCQKPLPGAPVIGFSDLLAGQPLTPYYQESGIIIYCADNRRVLPHLAPSDLLLTDPPFGIGFAAQPTTGQRKRGQARETWDDAPAEEWALMLARQLCGKQIIWGGNYFRLPVSRCWLSWYKPDAPPSMGDVEYAWTNLDQNSRQISQSIAATNGERVGHPTQKPLRVMGWALQQAGEVQTILDPWMGSGTTLVAAKLAGVRAIGIEANEEYCKLAVRRLAQGVLWPVGDSVEARNALQNCGRVHPYTCGNDRTDEAHRKYQAEHGGDFGQLVAVEDGWLCPVCGYTQKTQDA